MKLKVTDEQVIEEWRKQLTQKEIAENLGVTRNYISCRMKKIGLEPWYKLQTKHIEDKIFSIFIIHLHIRKYLKEQDYPTQVLHIMYSG